MFNPESITDTLAYSHGSDSANDGVTLNSLYMSLIQNGADATAISDNLKGWHDATEVIKVREETLANVTKLPEAPKFAIAIVNTDSGVSGHKAGCRDLSRGKLRKHASEVWEMTVSDKAEVWADYNADLLAEGGLASAWDIDWSPCANHVPEGDRLTYWTEADQAPFAS